MRIISLFIQDKIMASKQLTPKCVCLDDYRLYAKSTLSPSLFIYIDSGAEDSRTRKENSTAFDKILIMPRILVSTSKPDLTTTIFGHKLSLPIGFSPTLNHTLANTDGELISSYIAGKRNICYTQSIYGGKPLKALCKQNDTGHREQMGDGRALRFFQIYISKDWEITLKTIQLAQKYGFTGLVITVDCQVIGIRHGQEANSMDFDQFDYPILDQITNGKVSGRDAYRKGRDLTMNWNTIKTIRGLTNMKIVLKGITHPKDAKIAAQYNLCDAIWVSNHGGRQLDTVLPTIESLPMIKAAIGNKMPIFVDGGIRNGTDIFKCIALGADCVFIGRPVLYSLTQGQEGVDNMVAILKDQLNRTLILAGVKSLEEVTAKYLKFSAHL